MALIVEDGTGVTNANTYADIATMDEYHSSFGNTAWTGDDTLKSAAILRAMRYLEAQPFIGTKALQENELEWPRTGAVDRNGFDYASDTIPTQIVRALCEAALVELETNNALSPTNSKKGIKVKKIGPLTTEYFAGASTAVSYGMINNYLVGLVMSSNSAQVVRT